MRKEPKTLDIQGFLAFFSLLKTGRKNPNITNITKIFKDAHSPALVGAVCYNIDSEQQAYKRKSGAGGLFFLKALTSGRGVASNAF